MARNIVIEMTGDEHRLFQAMQKVLQQQDKMEAGMRRVSSESKKAGRATQQAFGSTAARELRNYVVRLAGVSTAISQVISTLHRMNEISERAAERGRFARMGLGSLSQLAETPEDMQRLVGAAKQTLAEGGAASLDEAARVVFALESAGVLQYRKLFSQLKATGIVEAPDVMARAAKTLYTAMGAEETGTIRDLVSKAFGASKFSPATAEALLEGAARGGTYARALRISDEELLAATALTATASGSAELGGTQIRSFLASLDQAGDFVGKSLREAVLQIQSMGLEGEELQKFLGRKEAVTAFRVLSGNLEDFGRIVEEVRRAEAEDRVGKKLALPATVPEIAAAQRAQEAAGYRELAELRRGAERNFTEALINERLAEREREGMNRWVQAIGEWSPLGVRGQRWLFGDEYIVRMFGTPYEQEQFRRLQSSGDEDTAALARSLAKVVENLDGAAKALQEAARSQTGGPTLGRPDDDPRGH